MSTIEKKITDAVLKRIRARRSKGDVDDAPDSRPKIVKTVSVREARFSDFEHVYALNAKLGQGQDSPANWKRLWLENPAVADGKTTSVIGWVLETSSRIVGFMGSIPLLYDYQGKSLLAVVASRLAVEPAYRSFSHLLIMSFFRQKNIDLFLNTTATVSAGKMMMAFKAATLPQKDYGNVLFWVIDPHYFTKSVFRRIGIAHGLIAAASILASLAVKADIKVRGRKPQGEPGEYAVIETGVSNLGNEFQRFWSDKSNETSRLMAKRTEVIMRWHFDPPGSRRVARVLGCYSGNHLVGYGIVRHDEGDGLRRSVLADLMVQDDDTRIVEELLAAIYKSAKNAGSHVLEVMGFPKEIRQIFLKYKPYSRKYPACPFFYKARDRALHERLADEDAWYACPFDGDGTLMP